MKTFVAFWTVVLISSMVSATPAINVQLNYDPVKGVIHIEADHPTDSLDKHYIHRALVINSDGLQQSFYFSRQSRADKFIADLDYSSSAGDHLKLKFFCIKGGVSEAGIDIPESAEPPKKDKP